MVVPVFNEERNVRPMAEALAPTLAALGAPYEIIFVDDGSSDGTLRELHAVCETDARVRFVALRRNFGKAAALSVGFAEARGARVVTLDGDLQDGPREIPKLLARLDEGPDLVSGWKWPRRDPPSKTWPSRVFNRVVRLLSGVPLHDFNCGLKAYRAEVVKELSLYGEMHRYIPVLASRLGFTVAEVQVEHHPRLYGTSKYGLARLLRGMFDLVTVLFLTRYGKRPLHAFGSVGLVCSLLGCSVLAYMGALKLAGQPIGHRPLLTLGVLLTILGAQWVTFGLLGEMLTRNADRGPADYAVRERRGRGLS